MNGAREIYEFSKLCAWQSTMRKVLDRAQAFADHKLRLHDASRDAVRSLSQPHYAMRCTAASLEFEAQMYDRMARLLRGAKPRVAGTNVPCGHEILIREAGFDMADFLRQFGAVPYREASRAIDQSEANHRRKAA